MNKTSKQIEGEPRRWHVGGRIGFGFSPELFMFGPSFSEHLLFQPNVEFGFGELTDMFGPVDSERTAALNESFDRQSKGAFVLDTRYSSTNIP